MSTPSSSSPAPEAKSLLQGRLSTFYRVTGEVLGAGLNGKVKLAVNRQTGKSVAVKTFKVPEMGSRTSNDLSREIQIQASLQHPNVARLEAVFESNEHVHLLVEHLEGGEVFEHLLQEGSFGESQAARVIEQLLRAVEHAHAQDIVHRDIKLENIMYASSDKDRVKLIDFGFGTSWRDGDKPMKRRCGTQGYMAPEVLKMSYTNKADMWSVGVVAHALLTGDMVGRNKDWAPVFSKRLPKCSLQAQKFVAALLAVDPDARLTAQQALGHCWLLGQGQQRSEEPCGSDGSTGESEEHVSETSGASTSRTTSSRVSATWNFVKLKLRRSAPARKSRADFSSLCPACAKPESPAFPKSARPIWQALKSRIPTLKLGACKKASVVPA